MIKFYEYRCNGDGFSCFSGRGETACACACALLKGMRMVWLARVAAKSLWLCGRQLIYRPTLWTLWTLRTLRVGVLVAGPGYSSRSPWWELLLPKRP